LIELIYLMINERSSSISYIYIVIVLIN